MYDLFNIKMVSPRFDQSTSKKKTNSFLPRLLGAVADRIQGAPNY